MHSLGIVLFFDKTLKKVGIEMNEKCALLLKGVINKKYENVTLDKIHYDDNEFYYEFNTTSKVSKNDLASIERDMRELDKTLIIKLIRVSGVYYQGDKTKEMITRIVGKSFMTQESLETYLDELNNARTSDHRKIGQALDLFCFSDYVGPGLPLYTTRNNC